MGFYRLILALCVASMHFGLFFAAPYNQGIIAVVCFMLLSGYVMTLLIGRYYSSPEKVRFFYLDRFARLLPQFWFYSLCMLLLMQFTAMGKIPLQVDLSYQACTPTKLFLNFTLFGNNFCRYLGQCQLLPPLWSLGLESFFYAMIPWFLLPRHSDKARLVASITSIGVFMASYLGRIDSDLYAYRYITGTLHIFLTGSAIALAGKYNKIAVAVVWLGAVALWAYALRDQKIFYTIHIKDLLMGQIIGIPALVALAKLHAGKASLGKWEAWAGNISYGLFLNHVIVKYVAQVLLGVQQWNYGNFTLAMLASIALSYVTYMFVERPALNLRRKLRTPA